MDDSQIAGTSGDPPYVMSAAPSQDDHVVIYEEEEEENAKQQVLSMMALNKIYMEFIGRLVLRVDRALERNRELQAIVKGRLTSRKRIDDASRTVNAALPCYAPYFKDAYGMAPRHNVESKEIQSVCDVDPLLPISQPWTDKEIQKLRESVHASLYDNAIVSLNARKDILLEKLKKTGVEDVDNRKTWLVEIERINRRLIYLKNQPITDLVVDNYSHVDWAKISATDFAGVRSTNQLRMKWHNELTPQINNTDWTPEEDERLRELIRGPWLNWEVIADQLGTGRTAYRCFERSKQITAPRKGPWTVEEDEKLESLIDTLRVGSEIPWHKIASFIPDRTKADCRVHYERHLNRRLKRGRWSPAEDLVLLICVNKYGPKDWPRIASIMQNRSALQCRDRFINVLDDKRRKEPWLWEEHELLFCGIRIFGRNNFSKIALLLPGRNHVDVKARIRALIRYRIAKVESGLSLHRKYRNIMPSYIRSVNKLEEVKKKFHQFSELIAQFDKNGRQIDLRMGIGAFLRAADGKTVDYSLAKQMMQAEFGKFVCQNGRWLSSSASNPNEYGRAELDREMAKLPPNQRDELTEFLRDSDVRYTIERTREKEFLSLNQQDLSLFYEFTDDRLARLDELITRYLPIRQQDMDKFLQQQSRRVSVPLLTSGDMTDVNGTEPGSLAVANGSEPQGRKRSCTTAVVETMPASKRMPSASCRFFEEIRRTILSVPLRERRLCVIRNICEYIHRGDELEHMKRFERRGLRTLGLRHIQEYLASKVFVDEEVSRHVIDRLTHKNKAAIVKHGNIIRIVAERPKPMLVAPYPELFENHAIQNETMPTNFPLHQVLSELMAPCGSSLNAARNLDKSRAALLEIAARLFDAVDVEKLAHRPANRGDEYLDIRLSPEIVNADEYVKLKQRIYRIMFIPLIMQKVTMAKDSGDRRRIQRLTIEQRRSADSTFVETFLKDSALQEQLANSSSSCQIFKTYDNRGAHSLENERVADPTDLIP